MSPSSRQLYRLLTLLVLLTMLVTACGPATPKPTETPALTPTPAATPLPFPAPRLLAHRPASGEEQALDAPIELTFDQPMNRASVEAAFSITPTAAGAFSWSDDRTVTLAPTSALQRGTRYRVTVAATATNAEGKALEEEATFDLGTVGYLDVSEVQPPPGADEINPDTVVTVVFNRPVVPLTALGAQGSLPDPVTLMPPVRGKGEWLNSAIYLFHPEEGLMPGTKYQARIAAGLSDTSGGVLAEDYTWTFTTLHPAVQSIFPWDQYQYVGPSDVISVTFNQPMDHASVEGLFTLQAAGGEKVAGSFRWAGGETPLAPETLVFAPSAPLARGTTYVAQLKAGALNADQAMAVADQTTSKFTVVNEPGLLSSSPRDGEQDWPVYDSVTFLFASPMNTEAFTQYLSITPPVTVTYVYWAEYDTQVQVSFDKGPATPYAMVLDGQMPDKYGAPLGKTERIRFTTGDLSSLAELNTAGRLGAVSAYTDTILYASYRNVSRLDLELYRVSPSDFMWVQGFGDWDAWDKFKPQDADLVRKWSRDITAARNQTLLARFDLTDEAGAQLPPGLYYVQMTAPETVGQSGPSRFMFVRSRYNLVLKQARNEVLVWSTDLGTGQPIAELPLAFFSKDGQSQVAGSTDATGLFQTIKIETTDVWAAFFAMAGQPGDDNFAIASNNWSDGISTWDFNVEADYWNYGYVGYLYTDRPIYRPGQTVYFKGILRGDDDAHYRVPTDVTGLNVRITDPQGKELYNQVLPVSNMGTLYSEFVLDGEAALGPYTLEMSAPDLNFYYNTSFNVAEYKKPDFQVDVTTDRAAYLSGDDIATTAETTYYFGGPVADAAARWNVLSADYYFTYQCPLGETCPWYDWTDIDWDAMAGMDMYPAGELIASGEGRTDANGRFTFSVPADVTKQGRSQTYTIEASVTDINNQEVSNRTTAIVHQGEFYVGLAPRGYVSEAGQDKQIDILTADWDSQPVAGVPLTVIFYDHRWYSVRQKDESGFYFWNWISQDIPVYTTTVTTGDDGKAVATFAPAKAGLYRVRAIGRDSREHEIRSSTYFWAWGGAGYVTWRQDNNNRITLVADKKEYEVGDTAEILVSSPYSGTVQALVTVERGHIMQSEVRTLQGNSDILRIPITEEYVPDVFVSVVIVQGSSQAADGIASFKMGLIELPVSIQSKELKITLTPDKDMAKGEHYAPRQTATYDILVTDSAGKPVEAELSLRLADLAVLALADEVGPSLQEAFWHSRGLAVKTSMPLVVSLEQFNREIQPGKKGGGGGPGEEGGGFVRTRFADTAYWGPAVRTGKDGKAQVQVELPDNLTTWRMQARGITADTLVGRVDVDILSTLDLLVRPVLPRFFVVGDQAQIAVIVQNNTDQPLDVEVGLGLKWSTPGNTGQPAGGGTYGGTKTVQVPAKGNVKQAWPITVQDTDQLSVTMSARSGLYSDARQDLIPVYRYSTPEVVATAGRLSEPGSRQEVIQLPSAYDPTQGELTVQVDGSLAAATKDALTYLQHYPYECVEQTVSRFLPNVLTYQALREMGLSNPDLERNLAEMVGVALQRLYSFQHYDGGWGWWTTDDSNAYLTAYVLHGLLEARRAGFVVDEGVMEKGASFLRSHLSGVGSLKTHWEANRLAYMLYVLAEHSTLLERPAEGDLGVAIALFEKRSLLDHYGQAMLAMALGLLEPNEPTRVQTLLANLTGDAIVSATGTHWEEKEPDYWNMNTDTRTTAIVLWAASRLNPQSEALPNVVRWLMAGRQEGHWETTQETAWSLLGLVAYMRASGEMEGDFSYAVYLNGSVLGSGDVNKANIAEGLKLRVEIAKLLKDEANRLVVERQVPKDTQTGKGQLYYSAYLRYYLPADLVKALDRGIIVAREYSPVGTSGKYVTSAQVGDVLQVKLTIIAPTDLYYVVVEDPLPAGCEGVDTSLKTTSVVGQAPELQNLTAAQQDYSYRWNGWGWWWFSHTEMRDEKVVLFSSYLPRGTYEYTYLMRASVPGEFLVIPSNAYQMYFPEVFGRSDGGKFTVTEP
jgi:uncharacterized protein YfaS (alpha-2-macroglobulin family)